MFTSGDKEPGAKKRSVLDRLEDSKFSKSSPPKEDKGQELKQKKEMADSMRRFTAREEMAERMAAFQPKKNERGSSGSLDQVGKKSEVRGKGLTRSLSVNDKDR